MLGTMYTIDMRPAHPCSAGGVGPRVQAVSYTGHMCVVRLEGGPRCTQGNFATIHFHHRCIHTKNDIILFNNLQLLNQMC